MEYLVEFFLFFAKTLIVLVAIVIPILLLTGIAARQRLHQKEHLEVSHMNRRYQSMSNTIKSAQLPKKQFKEKIKRQKKQRKKQGKQSQPQENSEKNIYVLEFEGDTEASAIDELREEITAVLTVATPDDEVVVKVESRGGVVHGYGLAASQLKRVTDKEIALTVAVDKVAASGGYLMACVADKIIAAPFAVIGSVGVVAQVPNFHRVLEKHDIDYQEYSAGEYKRTVGMFTEPTAKGKAKFSQQIEDVHTLFKDFVKSNRPQLEVDEIATGEHWYGSRAIDLKLVDEITTSDDYLLDLSKSAEIYEVTFVQKTPLAERLGPALAKILGSFSFRKQALISGLPPFNNQ